MIVRIGRSKPNLGRAILATTTATEISYAFAWDVGFYHSSGGLKKDLYIFGSTECPIKNIQIELNKRIMGAAKITMSYLDFPLHSDDYVIIKYKGTVAYRGLVDYAPDPKDGILKLVPYSRRFKELLIDKTYTSQTASAMLEDIITTIQADTGISWNEDLIDTGESTTYSKTFEYVTAEKAIREIVDDLSDREWGVTVNNVFTVYQPSTTVDEMFFQTFSPEYTKIKAKTDWKKIKATRYQVFKKNTAGNTTRVGEVGTGGSYPAIDLEKLVRKKEKKYNIDTFVGSTEALDNAYSRLVNMGVPESVQITNFNLDRYFPVIGDRLQVQDEEEKVLRTIIDCDASTGWTGGSSDASDYVEGSGSISFSSSSSGDQIYYDFGQAENFRSPERVGMMIKASETGTYLELGMSNDSSTIFDTTTPIPIYTAGVWTYRDFPRTTGFRYWGINTSSGVGATSTVKVDQVSMYLWHRKIFEGNIVKVNITISSQNDRLCTITLNDYDEEANKDMLDLEKRVDSIEAVNQST